MKKFLLGLLVGLLIAGCGFGIYYYLTKDKADEKEAKGEEGENVGQAYKQYYTGDKISFNNESWHVITDSNASDDYVVALKDDYLSDLDGKPYYQCPVESDNGINCNGKMSNNYDDSIAKKYFDDTYINVLGKENLKQVDGYYVRLITIDELSALGCGKETVDKVCNEAPDWLWNDSTKSMSWAMSPVDNQDEVMTYSFGYKITGEHAVFANGVGSTLGVRPVINLLKSSIE